MAIPVNIRSKLSEFVNVGLAKAQAIIITRVQGEIRNKLEQLSTECPPPEVLKAITNFIQITRPIITDAEKKISQANKISRQLNPAIAGGNLLIDILSTNPIPPVVINGIISPVSVIPPVAPLVIVQSSKGALNRDSAVLQWARNLVEVLGDEGRAISAGVSTAQGVLTPISNQLNQLEALTQACYENQNLSDEDRKLIIDDLQGRLPQDPSLAGISYVSTSGRTYTIKVIIDPNSPEIASRRQAIVQDFRGITVLTGPSSFATRTQVLIDEIKFRIDNQLP